MKNSAAETFSSSASPGSVTTRTQKTFFSSFTPKISEAATAAITATLFSTVSTKRYSPCPTLLSATPSTVRWLRSSTKTVYGSLRVFRSHGSSNTIGSRTSATTISVSRNGNTSPSIPHQENSSNRPSLPSLSETCKNNSIVPIFVKFF